jgi:hypothetical protein
MNIKMLAIGCYTNEMELYNVLLFGPCVSIGVHVWYFGLEPRNKNMPVICILYSVNFL